jgi:hypothetical protein
MGWFRLYDQMAYDRKLQRIARELNRPYPYVVGAWTLILCIANDSPVTGKLMLTVTEPVRHGDVTVTLQCDECDVTLLFNAFIEKQLLALEDGIYSVVNWNKRQFKTDTSATRTRKWRDSKRGVTSLQRHGDGDSDVTCDGSGDVTVTDQKQKQKQNTEEGKGVRGSTSFDEIPPDDPVLKILWTIPGWRATAKHDMEMMDVLRTRHPHVDLEDVALDLKAKIIDQTRGIKDGRAATPTGRTYRNWVKWRAEHAPPKQDDYVDKAHPYTIEEIDRMNEEAMKLEDAVNEG